jgi:hypothetical protein
MVIFKKLDFGQNDHPSLSHHNFKLIQVGWGGPSYYVTCIMIMMPVVITLRLQVQVAQASTQSCNVSEMIQVVVVVPPIQIGTAPTLRLIWDVGCCPKSQYSYPSLISKFL